MTSFFRNRLYFLPIFLLSACKKQEVQIYQIPAELERTSEAPASTLAAPKISLYPPASWVLQAPRAMRYANYSIHGAKGSAAEVSVTPLAGKSGTILENVNRWREQIQLTPLKSENDPELGTYLSGQAGQWFVTHIKNRRLSEKENVSAISTAILQVNDYTWFIKLSGNADLVSLSRHDFLHFVCSATLP